MQFYDVFYKRFGLRTPQQLMTPVVPTLDKFDFPKNSIYHFVAFDNVHYGPDTNDYLFRNISRQILMDHVIELTDNKGIPKKVSVQILPYIREYHMKNRRFRYLKDATASTRDENTLTVVNYGFVLKTYRYARSLYTEYYKWWNIQKTVWDNISETAKESNRNQFIFFDLPKTLPSVTTLNTYSNVFNQQMTKIFNTPESLFLLELWKWLGEDTRTGSVLGSLDKEDYSKVNIVYQDSGKWIMFNLGVLDSWRYIASDTTIDSQKFKIPPDQLQRRFLRLMMSFMSYRTEEVITDDEGLEDPIESDSVETKVSVVISDKQTEVVTDQEFKVVDDEEIDAAIKTVEETKLQKSDRLLNTLEEDLKELEVLESKVQFVEETTKEVSTVAKVYTDKTIDYNDLEVETKPEDNVIKHCDEMAENGLITAAEYRNLIKQSQAYKSIRSPKDSSKTLVEFAKIEPEEISIQESSKIADIKTVTDKSMLKSSLIDFDERYIKNILAKDVSGMVINIQKAGIILSNYEVEKISDVMGDYENHSMRIRPIQGVASTIRFKLPVVNDDGVFVSNGNKYTMRKQRGDNPIRKTAPDTVALTSYYGKTFVKRNAKKVNDYSTWFRNKIMSKGLDPSDIDITNLAPADVFDNLFKCPRIYSIVSQGFRSFTAGEFHFLFDHKERLKQFSPEVIKSNEKDGMVVIGYTDKNTYLVVDKGDAIYETSENGLVFKGSLDTILKIDSLSAPVEYSEIKIYGKTIAVGLILAYQIGLSKLMDILKVSPRRVLAGQRLNLEAQEYAIAFSDETLIFSREDRLATIVLAGFNEYNRSLRNFSVYTFDNPNVYLNVLETSGISARYLREIDLMTELFIDPITKELLIEMKEPTTFRGLLIRSSELLMMDYHPDQSDMKYMRIKGYERLSGAVYGELIRSIREQKSKSGRNRSAVELHPYAVWKRIAQDPSLTIVNDINPIQNLKEKEAVTYSGTGGRNSRSMTKDAREYHESDMGVISESTVDSGDVAINVFTSADPQFKSLRGTTNPYVVGESGATALLSTSALLAVGSDRDDQIGLIE